MRRVDNELRELVGLNFATTELDGSQAKLCLERPLGEGATAVAFFATRTGSGGEAPCVVKVFRPALVLRAPSIAEVSMLKEQGAMRRLNQRVPPSPYIVRMTGTGAIDVDYDGLRLSLPWISMEYVNGGVEGTTLTERLTRTVEATSFGFDAERALRAMTCVVAGLNAIHDCGLIHRDIKPDNVLLCGFGETEVAKITDFGVARAAGGKVTFGPQPVGTLGYAAPEQLGTIDAPTSTATDVFSIGVLLFRLLTAEEYFRRVDVGRFGAFLDESTVPRRALREARRLHPTIRNNTTVLDALDAAIRSATALRPERRPLTPTAFFDTITEPLHAASSGRDVGPSRRTATRRRLQAVLAMGSNITWSVRHRSVQGELLRSVAWEPDGRAVAVSRDRVTYWDGGKWVPVTLKAPLAAADLRFAHRLGPGRFLFGGSSSALHELAPHGWSVILAESDAPISFECAAGSLDGLLLVGGRHAARTTLWVAECSSTGDAAHDNAAPSKSVWRTAIPLDRAAALSAVVALDTTRWVLAGKSIDGRAFLAIYHSDRHCVEELATAIDRPLLSLAGDPDEPTGPRVFAAGPSGVVALRVDGDSVSVQVEDGLAAGDISAVAVDPAGYAWALGRGCVYRRSLEERAHATWETLHVLDWEVPFIGLLATSGGITAVTVDGAVLEGREHTIPPSIRPSQVP